MLVEVQDGSELLFIEFESTGEVLDTPDPPYVKEEVVEGWDKYDHKWQGTGVVVCGELEQVNDIEKL